MNADDYEALPTNSITTHMTAGAIAGIMEHCIMYPLDSVKTRMQSLSIKNQEGIIETFARMVQNEGVFRPVRGMSAMIVGAGPSHALYFSTYEFCKSSLSQKITNTRYHPIVHGSSGCLATLIHDAFMNPAEVIKQRLQMSNSPYKSVLQCLTQVYRTEGLGAFYRSYTTQLTMNIPFQSIHFMVYEWTQKIFNKERVYNAPAHMLSGGIAGGVAAAITTPLDVCKTLLNTQQGAAPTGMIHAVKMVYRLGGPMGFFRGMQARVVYTMPSTAICWSTYEFFKYALGVKQVPMSTVLADEEVTTSSPNSTNKIANDKPVAQDVIEKINIKPRELPSMSGGAPGLFGTYTFNTMHTSEATSFNHRSKGTTVLDIACHTTTS